MFKFNFQSLCVGLLGAALGAFFFGHWVLAVIGFFLFLFDFNKFVEKENISKN